MKILAWRLVVAGLLLTASCNSSDPDSTTEPTTSAPSSSTRTASGEPLRTTLPNGLDVVVTPVPDATGIAVTLVFDIGSHHDPPSQSGLAHMVEHVFVTGPTDEEPVRTVDQLVQAYPLGWNAQTGEDFTVFATVIEPTQLDDEFVLVAARLAGVAPTEADLRREEPRLQAELINMFGGIPQLGAANLAREQLRPTPDDGRRGGHPDAVAALTLDDLARRLELYHPGNARLSVAGPVDPAATMETIRHHFGSIPNGPPIDNPATPPAGSTGLAVLDLPASAGVPGPGAITLAYPAPAADHPSYAAFLVAAGRLFTQGQEAGFVTSYAPLDDPSFLLVGAPLTAGTKPDDAGSGLHEAVVAVLDPELQLGEGTNTTRQFGPILGMGDTGQSDSYGVAFQAARAPRLGIDPVPLTDDLTALTPEDYGRLVSILADQPVTGGAIVVETPGRP